MIELSILDLLYFVLTFFIVIIGTLLAIVLLRVLKILRVWVELVEYYDIIKHFIASYAMIPCVIKDKIFQKFSKSSDTDNEKSPQDPIL
jgi:hypothetical protein